MMRRQRIELVIAIVLALWLALARPTVLRSPTAPQKPEPLTDVNELELELIELEWSVQAQQSMNEQIHHMAKKK